MYVTLCNLSYFDTQHFTDNMPLEIKKAILISRLEMIAMEDNLENYYSE